MIQIKNISLKFIDKIVFNDISWVVGEKNRIGLIGDNGTGKTTFFKAILGQQLLDEGSIELPKSKKIGYLCQDFVNVEPVHIVDFLKSKCGITDLENRVRMLEEKMNHASTRDDAETIRQYQSAVNSFEIHEGYTFESKARRMLKGLGFVENDFNKKCTEFSEGWKMRISLASVLLAQPDIMLLDEPTNFLDTESIEWLENFLRSYKGTMIAIVHDRMFLDKIVTQIAELSNGKMQVYKGNYSFYKKEKQKRKEILAQQIKKQQREIKSAQDFVERFRAKASKAAQVQSRVKMLEKMEIYTEEKESKRIRIQFPPCPKCARQVAAVKEISKRYEELTVFKGVSFSIERGERIALVGMNGAGKSTLLRLLCGSETPTTGAVRVADDVRFAFYSQEQSKSIDCDRTIWDDVCSIRSESTTRERRNLLGAFLFSGEDVYKKIAVLSGGEKSRLSLLKLLLLESNFLVLDEPTNHLDLKTKKIFQKALMDYKGTLLIVSHDRFFLDNLVGRVFEIRNRQFFDYGGNYSYFIEKRGPVCSGDAPDKRVKSKSSYLQRKEEARNQRALKKRIKNVEGEITGLESRQKTIEAELCDPAIYDDADRVKTLGQELKEIPGKLDVLYNQWNESSALLEKYSDIS